MMKKLDSNIYNMIRAEILSMGGYTPIDPIEVISERSKTGRVVKLDGNENPYGCSPQVHKALLEYPYFNIYPDPEQRILRSALEKHTGFNHQQIICGSGSDDLIDVILRLFINPGDKVINCPPTFGMYPFLTKISGGKLVEIPRDDLFNLDISEILKNIDEKTKVIFICSPNNPSGNCASRDEITELLNTGKIVVVDEAYIDFGGKSIVELINKYSNLIVLRTFSKWAGLAGLRIGYGIFPAELVPYIMKIKQPYNANAAAQVAVLASLQDIESLYSNIKLIIAERDRLFNMLKSLDWLRPYPSCSNFILCSLIQEKVNNTVNNPTDELTAKKIWMKLREKGIYIRYFNTKRLNNFIRISVGKREDSDILISALREVHDGR